LKILIITSFFPPQNSIASQRPYSWAKYWSRDGHDVTVLTVPKKPLPSDSPQSFEGFQVMEIPIPFMGFVQRIFSDKNTSLTPGLVDRRTQRRTTIKKRFRSQIAQWQRQYGIAYGCRMPDPMDFWCGTALKAVRNQQWDLVVSTAWPYGVHGPAYRMKKAGIARHWIADWRDLWTDNHMYPGLPVLRALERILERRWSLMADAITTVSMPLADVLRVKYGSKVHVIYNGFDQEDYTSLPAARIFPDDGVFRIVYTGSIYAGQQDPSPLFEAVRNLKIEGEISPERLKIIFCGNNADVTDLARMHAVEEFVEYAGFLPRQQALRMQRDADALLFLEFESDKIQGILTGKLFEYLFAGPHILGVGVGDNSSAGQLFRKTGRGECFGNDVKRLAREIRLRISNACNPAQFASKVDYPSIMEFSREVQSKKMLKILS
jgi:glycosyltransferase involved in cell wall biosynthesis